MERVRFAPSPTGYLHLGGLRTALFNYLLARNSNGQFILRIEDTDKSRSVSGAVQRLIEILTWAGISYDEGPGKDNSMYGPYVQSMRLDIYKRFAKHLLEGGRAYKCYCSRERLEGLRQVDGHGRYDGHCRNLPLQSPVKGQDLHVVRFRVPPGSVKILDSVYGTSEISNRLVDDAILMKSDGFPTYHFANVIDDHQMSITTVMRGQEWLPSTALHLLLYQAFDWVPPRFMHLPLLINKDGSKLSKRQNDAFVEYYLNKGYFPSALLNFVAFLGWNPPTNRELMSLDDLVKEFNVERINKANPLVDMDKLLWYNQSHLQMILKSNEFRPLIDRLRKCIKDNETFSDDYLLRCIQASSTRIKFIEDIPNVAPYFFHRPALTPFVGDFDVDRVLKILKDTLVTIPMDSPSVTNHLKDVASAVNTKLSNILKALRVVLTGDMMGPGMVETITILGAQECADRINLYLESLNKGQNR